jgi:hypothetical protein
MISRLIGVWFFGGFPVAKTLSLGIEAAKATNFQFCHSQRGPITADFHRHLRFFHLTAAVILSMVTLRFFAPYTVSVEMSIDAFCRRDKFTRQNIVAGSKRC